MKARTWTALGIAAVLFPLTFLVWPPEISPGAPATAQALGYGLVVAECLAMGAGLVFLVTGYSSVRRLGISRRLAGAAYCAIAFALLNWWTHDHLHAVADGFDFDRFIWMTVAIEFLFHGGLVGAGLVLAVAFMRLVTPGWRIRSWRLALIVIPIALISVPASLVLFPPPQLPAGQSLPAAVLPFLLLMKLIEGIGLGAAVAFVIFARRGLRAAPSPIPAVPALIAITWYLGNWWPHDNFHLIGGGNVWALLAIEYSFHVTLIAAAGVLAVSWFRVGAPSAAASPSAPALGLRAAGPEHR